MAKCLFYLQFAEEERKALHKMLVLRQDRPLLRKALAVRFPDEASPDGFLRNVHIGLSPSGGEFVQVVINFKSVIFHNSITY